MGLLLDLRLVAIELLEEFGGDGILTPNYETNNNAITGGITEPLEELKVRYYLDSEYGKSYLRANATGDDARLIFYFYDGVEPNLDWYEEEFIAYYSDNSTKLPSKAWGFKDNHNQQWNIVDFKSVEVEGEQVVYEATINRR